MVTNTVHLHTILQRQTPEGLVGRVETTLPAGSSMADLMAHLEIDFPLDALLLVVNGRVVETDYVLQDNEKIHFMPAISGG